MAETTQGLVSLSSASVAYGRNSVDHTVFDDVSLVLNAGEIVGVFGGNGTGKTTLLNALLGTKRIYSGSRSQAPAVSVGVIPQAYRESFFPWASLLTNCCIANQHGIAGWKATANSVRELSSELGVAVPMDLRPGQCSGGMLQQAAIVRALAGRQNVLIADEPFAALDVKIRAVLRRRVRSKIKSEGIAAIAVMHDLEDLAAVADRVLVITGSPFTTGNTNQHHRVEVIDNKRVDSRSTQDVSLQHIARQVLDNHS